MEVKNNEHFFLCCLNFENTRRSLFINISSISSSFKNLPSHLKVELLLFGDSELSAISNNNLILKASIKYIMTTNRFSVPLFWYVLTSTPPLLLPTFFTVLFERAVRYGLCCIFLSLFCLSLCKIFFICFLSRPIVINYIVEKKNLFIRNTLRNQNMGDNLILRILLNSTVSIKCFTVALPDSGTQILLFLYNVNIYVLLLYIFKCPYSVQMSENTD